MTTLAARVMHPLFTRLRGGTLEVVDSDGVETFGPGAAISDAEPIHARVTVHDPRLYERLLRDGSVGLGTAYADGWWDADDLTGVLRLAHRSLTRTHPARDRLHRWARPLVDPIARRRSADVERDEVNVRSHYDIGNELFTHLLDESMMYSSAIFDAPDTSLAAASRAKLDRLAASIELTASDHVLEIGTGWGGFAIYAASTFGCRVTTTTISAEQYEFATARVHAAGLDHLVTVRADDYRTLEGTFDKIVAIEMIEAVDWREYGTFFAACESLLAPDGIIAMQAIVVPDASFDRAKRRTDFIKAAIFPGGCLPSVGALSRAAAPHRLTLHHQAEFGLHYAETLRRWRENLVGARDAIARYGFDDHFTRLWDFYFSYCEAGFEERYISVVQLTYTKPGWRPAALEQPAAVPEPVT